MRRHLAESRISHLEGAVLEELDRVRQELGWPIVMTPFAQMVITQAVMNVTGGRYNDRARRSDPLRAGPLRQAECAHRPGRHGAHRVAAAHARAACRSADGGAAPNCADDSARKSQRRGIPAARHDAGWAGGRHVRRRTGCAALRSRRPSRCWSCCTACLRSAISRRSNCRSRDFAGCGAASRGAAGERVKRARAARARPFPKLAGFMFDVDGTLLLSDRSLAGYELLPGAAETLQALAARAVPYVLLTNGSAYPPRRAGREAAQARAAGVGRADDHAVERRGRAHACATP